MDNTNKKKIIFITQFALLLALQAIFAFTPLGSLPIQPGMVATLAMLPVIITAILLGTAAGTLMGFFFGLFSFMVWTFAPPSPLAFLFTPFYSIGGMGGNFWSLVICFVPRILVGTVTGVLFSFFKRIFKGKKIFAVITYGVSAMMGSLTNTVLVVGGWFLFFHDSLTVRQTAIAAARDDMGIAAPAAHILENYGSFAEFLAAHDISANVTFLNTLIVTTITMNGIPEAIVSLIVGISVCAPLRAILIKQRLING